jgi:hypothetical protein
MMAAMVERRKKKIEARLHASNTFRAVAEDFISVRLERSGKALATITKARWFLSMPPILSASTDRRHHATGPLNVLRKVESEGKRETAVRTCALASRGAPPWRRSWSMQERSSRPPR